MDLKESSNSDGRGCLTLHDDELFYLSKNYLKEQECLSLAMSGASDNYTSLYTANRKRLAIGRNSYHLTPTSWAEFFKECITPKSIITFDASHTYWLPPEVLLHSIVQMTNLEELCVQDTQISLSHLPEIIFKNCPKLVKLTFTLKDKTLNEDEMGKSTVEQLRNGFAKLTHLKIFNFAPDDGNERSIQSWLNLFQVLKLCRDCTHLVVKFASPEKSDSCWTTTTLEDKQLDKIESDIFAHLIWMKNLKSLAILNSTHYNRNPITMGYPVLTRLLGFLLPRHKCLERLWISDPFEHGNLCFPFLKSLAFIGPIFNVMDTFDGFEAERFSQLEHLTGIPFQSYHHLPHLEYVQGYFKFLNQERFNEFARSVPKLQHLHIYGRLFFNKQKIEGDWSLPLLKVLNFGFKARGESEIEFIQQVTKRCPNIEELYCLFPFDLFHRQEIMRFKHLKRLRIGCNRFCLTNIFFIFVLCPKLESLEVNVHSSHLNLLPWCLPSAANLRDFRLNCYDGDSQILLDLMEALLKNSATLIYFERLVILSACTRGNDDEDESVLNYAELEEKIVKFAKKMTHLVCLAIVGFPINTSAVKLIEKRLTDEVVPLRPAFWSYFGKELPNENDISVPRVHHEEIVNRFKAYFIPPPDILNLK